MFTKKLSFAGIVCALALTMCGLLYSQSTGSISGTVTDAAGAPAASAKVTVTAPATGTSRDAVTDANGHYTVPLLGVANFTVRVELQGFQAAEAKDVRLQVDEHRELDFKLAPATVQQNVEVTATVVAVQTTDATLGQVITSQQVADLPLNGRDFVQLATLTPGVTQETNPKQLLQWRRRAAKSRRADRFSLSVGGSRANSTDWLLDGNDNNELTAGGISILPSIDAIQEFKVLTYNYSAEWGTRAGPTVLVTTKIGTNQFHGTLFEFFRNTDLDARSFFAADTEKFNLNQFGASLGGPIRKDKTFFFADYEQKVSAARDSVHGPGSVGGDAQRRFHRRCIRQSPIRISEQSERDAERRTPTSSAIARAIRIPAAPDGSQSAGRQLQQDSAESDQSDRAEADQPLSAAQRQQSGLWVTTT